MSAADGIAKAMDLAMDLQAEAYERDARVFVKALKAAKIAMDQAHGHLHCGKCNTDRRGVLSTNGYDECPECHGERNGAMDHLMVARSLVRAALQPKQETA
jgi:Zn finger protein HypA/HybF involved in hydrogenase expression